MEEHNLYSAYRFVSGAMNLLCSSLTHIVLSAHRAAVGVSGPGFRPGHNATAGERFHGAHLLYGAFPLCGAGGHRQIRHSQNPDSGGHADAGGALPFLYFKKAFRCFCFPGLSPARAMESAVPAPIRSSPAAGFPPREKSAAVTVNSLGIVAVTTLVYTCAVPPGTTPSGAPGAGSCC